MIDVVFLSFWILTDPLQAKILTFEERVRDFIFKTRIKKIDQERRQILILTMEWWKMLLVFVKSEGQRKNLNPLRGIWIPDLPSDALWNVTEAILVYNLALHSSSP